MNDKEREYLENSILKPYLTHVEFEVMNIEYQINRSTIIKKAIIDKGFSLYNIENRIRDFLITLRQIQSIFRFNIN